MLFDKLKLPGGKKTKTGQWETRAGLLDDLAANEELPDDARRLINTMLDWRQLSKLRSTYTDALPAFIDPATGRIHTSYALAADDHGPPRRRPIPTCRTSRSAPRKAARSAPPSSPSRACKLISADYSQIELRVLAHIADIPQLKKAFADGLDIHAMTASEMFGVPIKGMPAEVRRRAKAINFGIIYGISAFGLANQLGISARGGGRLHQDLLRALPRHPRLHGRDARSARTSTATSRRSSAGASTIPEINTKNPSMRGFLERAAINAPIQGSAADIIRRAMIRMPAALEARGPQVGAHAAAGPRRTGVRGGRGGGAEGSERRAKTSWRARRCRRRSSPCRSTSTPRPPTTGKPRTSAHEHCNGISRAYIPAKEMRLALM